MRVLVTGAAGFIGSHVAERLAVDGHTVLGIDNFDPFYDRRLKEANVDVVTARGVELFDVDVRERDDVIQLVGTFEPDVVVHLAAKAGVRNSIANPADYVFNNLNGTQHVLDGLRAAGSGRLVLASTSSVYGDDAPTPFREDFPAVRPLQPYAASKRAAEMLAGTYHHLYGIETTVVRFFTVYGPRGRPDMMPFLLADSIETGREVPLFDGPFERDWTFIDDIVDGVVRAVEVPLGFEILNLGRGAPVALSDFIDTLQRIAGRSANLRRTPAPPSEMIVTFADTSKSNRLLGFEPQWSVEDGARRMWEWFREAQPTTGGSARPAST